MSTSRVYPGVLLVALWFAGPAGGEEPRPPKLRLGDAARPTRYTARLRVVPDQPRFEGTLDLELVIAGGRAPLDVLWLDGTDLTVSAAVFDLGGKKVAARALAGGPDFIGFTTGAPLPPGPARLHVEYSGVVSQKDGRGLFAQKEADRWYAITHFEAIQARRVFPCFDEPSFRAPWQLVIEAPADLVVLANTAPVSERQEHPGMKTVTFAPTAPLPTYLVAFAVGPYELVDAGRGGQKSIPIRIAVPPGRSADARFAATILAPAIDRLEAYFGSPFPFDKLDLVTVPLPTESGAMENPGMITFDSELLLARPQNLGLAFQRTLVTVATHELAHQWFGDLVTLAWWDDIWLNESFASWMADKIVDAWHPEWSHGTSLIAARTTAMGEDGIASARQIRQPIASNDDIYSAFDPISYQKGQAVIGMFEHIVGSEAFQRGLRAYLADHLWGNATADDFIAAIGTAAGRDLGPVFRSFLDQPGIPLVSVGLRCGAGQPATLALAQQRYVRLGSPDPARQEWQVPICARWPAGATTKTACTVLAATDGTLALPGVTGCPAWVLANADEVGYYRVSYQGDLLARLLGKGRSQLTRAELLGLLDDVRALVDSGALPLGDALALVAPLAADPRREVVTSVAAMVRRLDAHLVSAAQRPAYARFVRELFAARARRIGWTPRPGEDEDTRLLRKELVALVAGAGEDPRLRAQATALTRRWLVDRKGLDADVVGGALDTAARAGDRALLEAFLAEVKRAPDRRDRSLIIGALSRFQTAALAGAALGIVLDEAVDPRESVWLLFTMMQEPATRALSWSYVKEHLDALTARLPPQESAYLPYIPVEMCDAMSAKEMKEWFGERSAGWPGGPLVLTQATELLGQCQANVKAHRASAAQFLARH